MNNKDFSPEQLIEDFNFMIKTMEDVHPDLYFNISKTDAETARDEVSNRLTKPMSILEFYKVIGTFPPLLGDNHTAVHPFAYLGFSEQDYRFPAVKIDSNSKEIRIKKDLGEILKKNDLVLEVNGIKAVDILTEISRYIAAETESFHYAMLEFYFSYMLPALFNITPSFNLKVKRDSELLGVTIPELEKPAEEDKATTEINVNSSILLKIYDDTALLTIKHFRFQREQFQEALKLIDSIFLELKEKDVRRLIIDVRDNGGGNSSVANHITDYLTEKSTYSFRSMKWRSSQQVRNFVRENLKLGEHSFYSPKILEMLEDLEIGDFLEYDCRKTYKSINEKNVFQGDVVVLSNPMCFSSTTAFLCMIRDFNLGRIIGTESGGKPNHYGDCYTFYLPNTGLRVTVSQKFFVRVSGNEADNRVIPDIYMSDDEIDIILSNNGFNRFFS